MESFGLSASPVNICNDGGSSCSAPFTFVRGTHLMAPSNSLFGGLSSLLADQPDSLLAITDHGQIVRVPAFPSAGGNDQGSIAPLLDEAGASVVYASDAGGRLHALGQQCRRLLALVHAHAHVGRFDV